MSVYSQKILKRYGALTEFFGFEPGPGADVAINLHEEFERVKDKHTHINTRSLIPWLGSMGSAVALDPGIAPVGARNVRTCCWMTVQGKGC